MKLFGCVENLGKKFFVLSIMNRIFGLCSIGWGFKFS